MRISDWSSDVCSSDLLAFAHGSVRRECDPGGAERDETRRQEARGARETAPAFNSGHRHPPGKRSPHRCRSASRSPADIARRSEEHTSELQSLMRISYAVFCLKKKIHT